MQHQIWSS